METPSGEHISNPMHVDTSSHAAELGANETKSSPESGDPGGSDGSGGSDPRVKKPIWKNINRF